MIWYSLTEDHIIKKTKILRKNSCTSQVNVLPKMKPHPSESKNNHYPQATFFEKIIPPAEKREGTMNTVC